MKSADRSTKSLSLRACFLPPLSIRTFSLFVLLILACGFSPDNVNAFMYGSSYDVMLNAFVEGPDGEPGLEGHLNSLSILDERADPLPMNFGVPIDLIGKDLQTTEDMTVNGMRSETSIWISAQDGGRIVQNPLLEGSFGRVSISVSRLRMPENGSGPDVLEDVQVYLYDAAGNRRQSTEELYISGTGSVLEPIRMITSIVSSEFGQDTEVVEIAFQVVPEPNAGFAFGLVGLILLAMRRRRR